MEEWKKYNENFDVSNCGRIKCTETGSFIKINTNGPSDLALLAGEEKTVARLVAKLFLPGYKARKNVKHIDGNRHNNCIVNLKVGESN